MKTFKITEEHMKNAVGYIPAETKWAIAKKIALEVLEAPADIAEKIIEKKLLNIPYLKTENALKKKMYLTQIFISEYFGIHFKKYDTEEQNFYAGGNPLGQLEKWKHHKLYGEKAFNILADFRELQSMTETAIKNRKLLENDLLSRVVSSFSAEPNTEGMNVFFEQLKNAFEDGEANA
ncbi:MAG: hypothetical protein IJ489_08830 [Clostridia bacterium]|nr:hypothetical protein [Clostridia bacterium]